uniref:pumilio homolog 4 n=1 Tax=Erigeron canadensis TaxID=72917 RepID=UPI001CB95293|nr:pumilio homolog 4 [Erigeron canadensis]
MSSMEESMMNPLRGNLDSLESELELILNHQRESKGAVIDERDNERGVNMHRSGSAPPTVEGSLSAVGSLYSSNIDVEAVSIDDRNGSLNSTNNSTNYDMFTEDEVRSSPMYLSYYYAHGNFNPRLPPPLLSKEDWRLSQRFQGGGGSSCEGTRDWWKKNPSGSSSVNGNGSSSLFSVQPGLGLYKDADSELIEINKAQNNPAEWVSRPDHLTGLPAPIMGSRRKSFADILQEGLEQPASSSNRISHPASQNAISSNAHSSVLCNETESVSAPHSFTPVVGPSLSRNRTPEPQMARRSPSPGLPPVSSVVRPADVASSLSSLSLSNSWLPDRDNYSQCNYLDTIGDQRLSFQHRLADTSRKDDIGPVNFHRRAVSSADLNSNRGMFDFSRLEGSNIGHRVDSFPGIDLSGQMPTRCSAPNDHFASDSSVFLKKKCSELCFDLLPDPPISPPFFSAVNAAGRGQFLRRCNYPPPVMDSLHSHSPVMDYWHGNLRGANNNFVASHGHEDLQALHKLYLEALLAQQDQQYGLPFFGRSGSLNHIYGNPTYCRGRPFQKNLMENSCILSQQEQTIQFAPAFRNQVAGVSDVSLDRRNGLSLLDEMKNNKTKSCEISDVVGHVIEFSTDQYGSRFIQQKLEAATIEEKNLIFPEIIPHARSLMTDVFGNYVIQKLFEHGTESQRKDLAGKLIGHVLPLSLQMYGCRVIQKALEVLNVDQQTQIVRELDGSVMTCVRDQNGNHVIQKCIECVPQDRIQFMVSSFFGEVVSLSSHPYGCRVIQRVLEHCDDPNTQIVMDEIMNSVCTLAQDQYGNYVIQHVLQHGKPHERSAVISQLAGQIVKMSLQKFASNVVEKCLTYGSPEECQLLVKEMLGSTDENEPLQVMMKDPFGNYVVQKVLQTCDDQSRELILSRIKIHFAALKRYTFGKHIVTRVEKLIASGERHIAASSFSSS